MSKPLSAHLDAGARELRKWQMVGLKPQLHLLEELSRLTVESWAQTGNIRGHGGKPQLKSGV